MKTNYILALILFIFISSKEDKKEEKIDFITNEKKIDTVQIINTIKNQFVTINSDSKDSKKIEKEILGESTEGGVLVSCFKDDILKKVVLTNYGEMGKITTEYYFKENNIFFVFEKETNYDKPMYEKNFKVIFDTEKRYYLDDNQLIRWIEGSNELVDSATLEFKEKQKQLRLDLEELKNKLTN